MVPGFHPEAIYIVPECIPVYRALERAASEGKKPEQGIWKRYQTALSRIEIDGQWGETIPSRAIPRYFIETYGVTNLYCIDLAGDVRCFYTIEGRDILLLDIMDHDRYDSLFGLS